MINYFQIYFSNKLKCGYILRAIKRTALVVGYESGSVVLNQSVTKYF
jgi:hypothetical protein